jgi:hypothetical protein
MQNDEPRPNTKSDSMSLMQVVTFAAIVAFALLVLTDEQGVLPYALGILGLFFVGVALMAMNAFREEWNAAHPAADGGEFDVTSMVPLLFEVGLWGLAVLYVVRLVEIARG